MLQSWLQFWTGKCLFLSSSITLLQPQIWVCCVYYVGLNILPCFSTSSWIQWIFQSNGTSNCIEHIIRHGFLQCLCECSEWICVCVKRFGVVPNKRCGRARQIQKGNTTNPTRQQATFLSLSLWLLPINWDQSRNNSAVSNLKIPYNTTDMCLCTYLPTSSGLTDRYIDDDMCVCVLCEIWNLIFKIGRQYCHISSIPPRNSFAKWKSVYVSLTSILFIR